MESENTPTKPEVPEPVTTSTPPPTAVPVGPINPGASKAKTKMLAMIAGGVVLLILILAAAWFMYLSPAAQSKRLSASFMHAMTTGDVAKATDLTGDSTAKAFLTTTSSEVKGSYKLSQSKFSSGKGYYLYNLTGASKKYARTIVEKDKGKRVVDSFVVSNDALALVPATSSSSVSSTASTSKTTTSTTSDSSRTGCLTADDFTFFSNIDAELPESNGNGTFNDFWQLEFDPDVATYSADDVPNPTAVFNDLKNFYAKDANKKYQIELEASVNSATPDDALANARNAKVQSDLETISGIPASKIILEPNSNDTSTDGNTSGDSFNRQVQVELISADSCLIVSN